MPPEVQKIDILIEPSMPLERGTPECKAGTSIPSRISVAAILSRCTVCLWLAAWFALNMSVTIVNKTALNALNLPVTLTFVHMACNTIGAYMYIHLCRGVARKPLRPDQSTTMFFFSFIFVSNIIMGNWSLGLVTVSFNQVMRALVPGTTLVLSMVVLRSTYSTPQKLALAPIALGVFIACTGDTSATAGGVAVTAIAVVFASLKSVLSSKFLTGDTTMHPVALILHQAPLSALWCAVVIVASGEAAVLLQAAPSTDLYRALGLYFLTGVFSFALNVTSFFANKATSAVTLAVCANIKQVAVIALSVHSHGDPISRQTVLGAALVTAGGVWYSFTAQQRPSKQATL